MRVGSRPTYLPHVQLHYMDVTSTCGLLTSIVNDVIGESCWNEDVATLSNIQNKIKEAVILHPDFVEYARRVYPRPDIILSANVSHDFTDLMDLLATSDVVPVASIPIVTAIPDDQAIQHDDKATDSPTTCPQVAIDEKPFRMTDTREGETRRRRMKRVIAHQLRDSFF